MYVCMYVCIGFGEDDREAGPHCEARVAGGIGPGPGQPGGRSHGLLAHRELFR